MTTTLIVIAVVVAVAAAARSLWSPCSLSMLSTLTPLAERSRGHRYPVTAAWFVAGSAVGGLLPAGIAVLIALLTRAVGLPTQVALGTVAVAAVVCAASDLRVGGFHLPLIPRQVDETWLVRFRRWIYAGGFGVQIGAGLATYVMTAGVYLTILAAGLTGEPVAALVICELFAVIRGCCLLFGARAVDFAATGRVLRAIETGEPASRRAMVGVLGAVGAIAATAAAVAAPGWPVLLAAGVVGGVVALLAASALGRPAACQVPSPGAGRSGGAAASPSAPALPASVRP